MIDFCARTDTIRHRDYPTKEGNTRKLWIPVFVIAMMAPAGVALAAEEFCVKAKEELKGEIVTAKVPLFQTKIWPDEIRKLERDSDEIRQGSKAVIKDVGCGGRRVEVTLKPDGPGDKVEIYFYTRAKRGSNPMPGGSSTA